MKLHMKQKLFVKMSYNHIQIMDGKKEDFQILSQRHLEQINQNQTNLKNNDMYNKNI